MAIVQMKTAPPARYRTPFPPGSAASTFAARMGDTIPKRRPQKLASPDAVPRTGAGKTSGVHPYSIALNMLWKKYSIILKPMFDAFELTVAKRKSDVAMRADEMTIPILLPIAGTAYMTVPSRTPTVPGV